MKYWLCTNLPSFLAVGFHLCTSSPAGEKNLSSTHSCNCNNFHSPAPHMLLTPCTRSSIPYYLRSECHISCSQQTGRRSRSSSPHDNSSRLTHQYKTPWDQLHRNPPEPGKENTLVSSGEESFVAWIEVNQRAQDDSINLLSTRSHFEQNHSILVS